VDEGEIERVVTGDQEPDEAVRSLIDMANANGGPDNISATLVCLIDVPEPKGALMLPDSAIPAEGITQPLPAVGTRAASKSVQTAKTARAAKAREQRRVSARRRLVTNGLRALVAVLIVAIAAGFWYFAFGPYGQRQAANQDLQRNVAQAQQAISQAPRQDPATALTSLARARDLVVDDLDNPNLDASYRAVGEDMLAKQLQPAVQQAIERYNSAALVTPVNVTTAQFYRLSCQTSGGTPTTLTSVTQLAAMNAALPALASSQILYVVSSGQLYQVVVPADQGVPGSGASCLQISLSGIATVVAITGDGTTLNILAEQPSGQYVVMMVTTNGANSDGTPKTTVANRFNVATAGGETPELIAVSGVDVYISYSRTAAGIYGVWHYSSPLQAPKTGKITPPPPKPPTGPAQTVMLQRDPVSLAYSHNILYMLDSAGGLSQINTADKFAFSALPVQIPSPLQPVSPNDYSVAAPVPTPAPTPVSGAAQTPSGAVSASLHQVAFAVATATPVPTATAVPVTPSASTGTLFGKTGTLVIDPAFPTNVLICDATLSRLVRLVASASGPGLGFAAQYAYDAPLRGATHVAVAPAANSQLVVYTWANNALAAYTVPETAAGA
jgi:hypothetical protein